MHLQAQITPVQGELSAARQTRLTAPVSGLPAWRGRSRWARFLSDEKSGKESLRAFPPKDLPLGTRLDLRQA